MRGDCWIVFAALVLEACVGYPQWLYARIGHPVVWIGALIGHLDKRWNDPQRCDSMRRSLGVAAIVVTITIAIVVGLALEQALVGMWGAAVVALLATTGLAQRSLYTHVRAVIVALDADDIDAARASVARIVGRDTATLSHDQVTAAALESLAESFNDAVVAPAFWLSIGGLPGLLAYKAANTADSMIGHLEPRWRTFGWASARLDDLLNLISARLAGLLLVAAAGGGFAVMLRDASKHASPNAGWPEAALAGGLSVQLGGPATYDGLPYERPTFGNGAYPQPADLRRGLHIYMKACALLWAIAAAVGAWT